MNTKLLAAPVLVGVPKNVSFLTGVLVIMKVGDRGCMYLGGSPTTWKLKFSLVS